MNPLENVAAKTISRLTPGDYWYVAPQWLPDGSFIVLHANHNYDIWKIMLRGQKLEQLTHAPGPEFSPHISPYGKSLVCLSSPPKRSALGCV